jgi:5-methylcytosine-specific restriction protein B
MHARPSKDSLVYWLEFKNDEEFPAKFGSIAGGSALKFGFYWRQKTGAWMTGSPLK